MNEYSNISSETVYIENLFKKKTMCLNNLIKKSPKSISKLSNGITT